MPTDGGADTFKRQWMDVLSVPVGCKTHGQLLLSLPCLRSTLNRDLNKTEQ